MSASRPTVYERQAPPAEVVTASLAGSERAVFWLEDAPGSRHRELVGDVTADLAVVGGGYCGLWTAVLAKRRDPTRRVVLLEQHTVGWAASGRNGGFCEASLTHGEANGRSRWPEEFDTLQRLGLENLDAFEQDVADLGLDCDFERNGWLAVAVEDHEVPWLHEEGGADVLGAEDVRAEVNSPTYLAGLWSRDDCALVHPAKLAAELARAATELGVEIFEHTPVTSMSDGRFVTLHTARGRVTAERVALATNVFPPLLKRYAHLMVPVYDYALMTAPLSAAQWADIGWQNRQGVGDLANHFHYYRRTADDRILFGGYDAIRTRTVDPAHEDRPETFRKLASHFFTTFPQLQGLRFTHRWAGAIDTSTRFCAFHGLAWDGRVAYSSGFTGLGVGATRFAAEVMLDRLAGQTTERTELEMVRKKPLPFPPEPLKTVGIEATRWSLARADHREGRRNLLLRTLDRMGLGFDS